MSAAHLEIRCDDDIFQLVEIVVDSCAPLALDSAFGDSACDEFLRRFRVGGLGSRCARFRSHLCVCVCWAKVTDGRREWTSQVCHI